MRAARRVPGLAGGCAFRRFGIRGVGHRAQRLSEDPHASPDLRPPRHRHSGSSSSSGRCAGTRTPSSSRRGRGIGACFSTCVGRPAPAATSWLMPTWRLSPSSRGANGSRRTGITPSFPVFAGGTRWRDGAGLHRARLAIFVFDRLRSTATVELRIRDGLIDHMSAARLIRVWSE